MSSTNTKSTNVALNALWQKQPKANAEFVALTYGALVAELVRDLETSSAIQAELDRMGHSMGIRCIEEVLAKAPPEVRVTCFADTTTVLRFALKLFMGVSAEFISHDEHSYSIKLSENPLTVFVELPPDREDLPYSQLFAGMVRGMLEMLQYECDCRMDGNEKIDVNLKQILQDGAGEEYQEE